MNLLTVADWKDYELIDCGNFEKLERFGKYTLIRPEPQAIWKKNLSDEAWNSKAHARFKREKQHSSYRSGDTENGGWQIIKNMPETWSISYSIADKEIVFKLALTSFGHIGVFPEQAGNWQYIREAIAKINTANPTILNLFAYTGGASMAARAFGADVTHLDSVKQVVSWARENMELSHQKDIRWVIEDALKFVRRESKRGKTYNGIIIDPPAYGRGPKGEKWVLEEGIRELLQCVQEILDPNNGFLILNLYSLGYSSLIAHNLVSEFFKGKQIESGEFYLQATSGVKLPLGIFSRFINS